MLFIIGWSFFSSSCLLPAFLSSSGVLVFSSSVLLCCSSDLPVLQSSDVVLLIPGLISLGSLYLLSICEMVFLAGLSGTHQLLLSPVCWPMPGVKRGVAERVGAKDCGKIYLGCVLFILLFFLYYSVFMGFIIC